MSNRKNWHQHIQESRRQADQLRTEIDAKYEAIIQETSEFPGMAKIYELLRGLQSQLGLLDDRMRDLEDHMIEDK